MDKISLNDQHVSFLTNSIGEKIKSNHCPEEAYDWYSEVVPRNIWNHCLVELNGHLGMASIAEFVHPESSIWASEKYFTNLDQEKASSEQTFNAINNYAESASKKIDYQVLLGEKTGPHEEHEIMIFFPIGTKKESILETFDILEEISLVY